MLICWSFVDTLII